MADDDFTIKVDSAEKEKEGTFEGEPATLKSAKYVIQGDASDLLRGNISLRARGPENERAERLWRAIRDHTEQISFSEFQSFVEDFVEEQFVKRRGLPPGLRPNRAVSGESPRFDPCQFVPGSDLYALLRFLAEAFLLARCGTCPPPAGSEEGTIDPSRGSARGSAGASGSYDDVFSDPATEPDGTKLEAYLAGFLGQDKHSYIRTISRMLLAGSRPADGGSILALPPLLLSQGPCLLELIWSYWMEEGMLVQTTNAIALRFQNVRLGRGRDPLAELELDPLRFLSGFIWGYVQDEPHRLSVIRRAYEYEHHYGLSLYGKAVPGVRPADVRSRFLEAFHDLLSRTARFYQEAADTTITPDAFSLLVALKDLHLILAEGAHNQFRDLPWTARVEMLVQQWMLARPEMREFLRGRIMVPYPEGWMGAVDSMKKLQGWSDTNIIHFRDLAVYGERLLLSIRHVSWNDISDPQAASDWALTWRPEIQGYIHAYRTATGVNLSDDEVEVRQLGDLRYRQPAYHLRNRLAADQRQRGQLRGTQSGQTGPRQLAAPAQEASINDVTTNRTRA
jgi:hypothetical protein